MLNYLYVAIGSAVGGVARYAIGSLLQRRLDDWAPRAGALPFPIGTLIVNVTGSFLLGALVVIIARQSGAANATRMLLAIGFCGGYTTFSTFSYDTVALLEGGALSLATLNVAASLALAFAGTFGGMLLTRTLLVRSAG